MPQGLQDSDSLVMLACLLPSFVLHSQGFGGPQTSLSQPKNSQQFVGVHMGKRQAAAWGKMRVMSDEGWSCKPQH